jgi:Xaa-Pro aminopeptidase
MRLQPEFLAVENQTLTVSQYRSWAGALSCPLKDLDGMLENLRQIKLPEEVSCIIRAQRIVEQSLHELLPLIKPGVSEQELVAELIYRFYRNGAEGLAFPVIILSGPNSSLPHGFPGNRRICSGDFITLDIGVKIGGYCSDMTRTFALGHASAEMKEVYELVLQAQAAGIAAIAPGKTGHETDQAARNLIDATKYAGTFGHGLGHSVGLICHDGMRAAKGSKDVFQTGNVITMEPGIYLPGRFGVRIEDMVWLSPEGTKNLTEFPKELILL